MQHNTKSEIKNKRLPQNSEILGRTRDKNKQKINTTQDLQWPIDFPVPFFSQTRKTSLKHCTHPFLCFSHKPKKALLPLYYVKPRRYPEVWRGRGSGDVPAAVWSLRSQSALVYTSTVSQARALAPLVVQATAFPLASEQQNRNKAQNRGETVYLWNAIVCM